MAMAGEQEPLAHLGLTYAEAEVLGVKVREWMLVNWGEDLPAADSLIWADLVQFINRESRAVIAVRGDAADGESEVA